VKKDREKQIARQLTDAQAEWLEKLSIILNIGNILGMGQVVVVHAGIMHGAALGNQDPTSVMNMRTINVDTMTSSLESEGLSWSKSRTSTMNTM
jgi:hypothetical protein